MGNGKTRVVTERTEWAKTIIESLGLCYSADGSFYQAMADQSEACLVVQILQDQGVRAGKCATQLSC
jgi:hypothetical protein